MNRCFWLLVLSVSWLGVWADDIVDDVYFWDEPAQNTHYEPQDEQTSQREEREWLLVDQFLARIEEDERKQRAWKEQIVWLEFIEDSDTQASKGTIVKAKVHREDKR